ncbi:hypothetical protein Sp245p_16425 (plasmid) [Azospirillum baldaniorum]|uniref:Uncharacterized protein n=1 Tax=Azospirillum baldaniorum TaxID=1064539 RepID=A0A9P1JTV4_9PROT|nr:hypothetical protein [Azospirillum baldaniorum]AWJ91430.1 hypothetical protein Sp245p_16425 [Azospirillum baldaniorum]TWA83714.1 hypothetical protein FBZ85_101463 [Azospirillum brasilense]CCC99721.1 protein of unknown function [Azospirillum baldaniorum]
MSGFYLMHRGWQDNPVFNDEPFSRRDAWVWLVETANYADGVWGAKGKTVRLQRGQLCRSIRDMAATWKWDRSKVSRFIARLVSDDMIRYTADDGVCLITICNYDRYQAQRDSTETATETTPRQERDSTETQIKEGNENKEGKESRALPGDALPDLAEQGVVTLPANDNPPEPAKQTKRGTRVPDGDLPDDWSQAANHTREKHQLPLLSRRVLGLRWENFRNYWGGLAGSKGLKADWRKTWLNDCISPVTERKFPAGQPPPSNANAPPQAKRQASSLSEIPLFFDTPTEV